MIELLRSSLLDQFGASLSMLNRCVEQCPGDRWEGRVGDYAFWHVAYHTLFFTDLYLSRDDKSFELRDFHREDCHFFGQRPWPPFEAVVADVPYEKDVLLEYVRICWRKSVETIGSETRESLEGPSGFWWYEVPRGEFHLINIRHIQHHSGQMSLYLRKSAGIAIDWASSGWNPSREPG